MRFFRYQLHLQKMLDLIQRKIAFRPERNLSSTPSDLGLGFEEIWIKSPSTSNLPEGDICSWWIPHPSPLASILFLHGNGGNLSANLPRIASLNKAGFSILAIDYRGYGNSSDALPHEESFYADARAAWKLLLQIAPPAPHVLYGFSLGGAIAIHTALTATNLDALVIESSFTSLIDVARTRIYRFLPLARLMNQRFNSREKINKISVPKLFIHGTLDKEIPIAMGRELHRMAQEPKKMIEIPNGGHHGLTQLAEKEWANELTQLVSALPRKPKPAEADVQREE